MTSKSYPPNWRELCAELTGWIERSTRHYISDPDVLIRARAALARWGHQPAPPAEEEVADEARYLARELRDQADDMSPALELFGLMHRAADLLEHQAAPVLEPALARINDILNDSGRIFQTDELEALELARQALEQRQTAPAPVLVAVAEQWPEFSDCDRADDRVWCFNPVLSHWKLSRINRTIHSHCLPATALPLPSGEVRP